MIHDNFITGLAKLLNGESFTLPADGTYSTSTLTLSTDMASSSFTGEVPSRIAITGARAGDTITWTYLRSGATVGSSSGETLQETALFDAVSSGNLLLMNTLPSILQTTTFDIEVNWSLTVDQA